MNGYPPALQGLIDELGRLPGIGPKSAQRIALYMVRRGVEGTRLPEAIGRALSEVRPCAKCFSLADAELCPICSDTSRESGVICVVEEPRDVLAFERSRIFRGRYHVLGGVINPMEGVGPDRLNIVALLDRLRDPACTEVVVATSATVEGEATAMYLAHVLAGTELKVSRLATGVPVGGDLDYVDEVTLARALEGRHSLTD